MGAKKKFQDDYPLESTSKRPKTNLLDDKRMIKAYVNRISKMLEDDPEMEKKAALIISQLINGKK